MSSPVPNKFPSIPPSDNCRLAVIGEAPGEDESVVGEPFVGVSGKFLRAILAQCGVATNRIFFGNVCQHHPPHNDISSFNSSGPEFSYGLERLRSDLSTFRPHCVLLLGRTAFRAARPDLCYQTKRGEVIPLTDWRGSVFVSNNFNTPFKCVATYHPAYILRTYTDFPFFKFDLARAVRHAASSNFTPRTHTGILRPALHDVLTFLINVEAQATPITFDIEGYPDVVGITMLSIVPTANPSTGIVIPLRLSGHYWSEDEEVQIWSTLSRVLANPAIPKTCHNCFYELFVFAWRHRCVIANLSHDTMMAHWELYPDFAQGDKEERRKASMTQKKRSLGICASLYTEQAFYKDDRLSNDQEVKLNYSFLDSSVTAEVHNVTMRALESVPTSNAHYRFNTSLIYPYTYLMLRGCRYDSEKARALVNTVDQEIAGLNTTINQTLQERGVFHAFPVSAAKEKHRDRDGFNVKSPDQKCWLLYDHLGFKPVTKWGHTSNEQALLHFWKKSNDPLLRLVIQCVRKRTRHSDIEKLIPDTDGRIRCAYDIVGTNTGRLSSRKSMSMILAPNGDWINTGSNLQNQTKDLRVCYIPDTPDHIFFQCDLSGADAWTVAAELAALGHSTMLDDMLAGIKPSLVLCHMINEHAAGRDVRLVNFLTREQLKTVCSSIRSFFRSVEGKVDSSGRPLDWLYLCSKRVQHGCLTPGHEVLTRSGWKPIEQLTAGEEILTWHNKTAVWDIPSRITDYEYTGRMCALVGESYQVDMTADHKVLFSTNNNFKSTTAEELFNYKNVDLPKSAHFYNGSTPDDLHTRLIAAYQADGCFTENGDAHFHFRKERKTNRLIELLTQARKPFRKWNHSDGTVTIAVRDAIFNRRTKKTDWWMLGLSAQAMSVYLDEAPFWDGYQTKNKNRTEIFSADQTRIEVIHTMAHLCSRAGRFYKPNFSGFGSTIFKCSLNNQPNAALKSMERKMYDVKNQRVLCVTVQSGYFFCRRNGHIFITGNSNYAMGGDRITELVFEDSDGSVVIPKKDAELYQYFYKLRYKTDARNDWIRKTLEATSCIVSSCGVRRQFFGIRNRRDIDDGIIREASAFNPQCNTTYLTNLALSRLYYSPTNRRSDGSLFVEPLIQIHDALAGQFLRRHQPFARDLLTSCFTNRFTIAGVPILIPFEGNVGLSWKETTQPL